MATMKAVRMHSYGGPEVLVLEDVPRTVAHVQAASIPIAGLTAWQTLFDAGQLAPGQRVLVHGAGGAVGGFAVQFAALRGARVTALTGADQLREVAALGAEHVFDYGAGRFEDSVGEQDLVLDVIGGEIQERSLKLLRKGGILVSTVGVSAAGAAAARGVKAKPFMVQPNAAQLAEIAGLVDVGKLRLNVGTVLPLAQARTAHELVQSGRSRGKVVLQVRQDSPLAPEGARTYLM